MPILDTIRKPSYLRSLSIDQLRQLAKEMRHRIFESVSKNGGHLASNLGVVELTIALHRVFDFGPFPTGPDRLLFDVGHQCYPHKMLTGRAEAFPTLRKKGSVSGFPAPDDGPEPGAGRSKADFSCRIRFSTPSLTLRARAWTLSSIG